MDFKYLESSGEIGFFDVAMEFLESKPRVRTISVEPASDPEANEPSDKIDPLDDLMGFKDSEPSVETGYFDDDMKTSGFGSVLPMDTAMAMGTASPSLTPKPATRKLDTNPTPSMEI